MQSETLQSQRASDYSENEMIQDCPEYHIWITKPDVFTLLHFFNISGISWKKY